MASNNGGFHLFRIWNQRSIKYSTIRDSEKRATSISFGVKTIIASVFCVVFAVLFALCLKNIGQSSTIDDIVLSVLYIIGMVICGLSFLSILFTAIIDVQYQLRLNKKAIGWIALIILILALAGSVVAVLMLGK